MVLKNLVGGSNSGGKKAKADAELKVRHSMVCPSYRGSWTSRGRPSERGLNIDAAAGLCGCRSCTGPPTGRGCWRQEPQHHGDDSATVRPVVLVWGQNIGSGIATNLAAVSCWPSSLPIDGLVLETSCPSAPPAGLHPQRGLPYRHLWSPGQLGEPRGRRRDRCSFACHVWSGTGGRDLPSILLLIARNDEVVPAEHAEQLYQRCQDLRLPVEGKILCSARCTTRACGGMEVRRLWPNSSCARRPRSSCARWPRRPDRDEDRMIPFQRRLYLPASTC